MSPAPSILIAGWLTLLLSPAVALAFESSPEFQSLTEEEASAFEGPELLGSEYTSDVHSYGKPLGWEYGWLASDIVFDGVVGSTSSVHFMMDARIKARAVVIPERLEFRFTWFDESHREREARHTVLEIVSWLHPRVGLSVYGEPSLYKRQADLGAAVLLRPGRHHEARLFLTLVDVVRAGHSDRQETYAEGGAPMAAGLVGRMFRAPESGTRDFLEYALRWEKPTRWYLLTEQAEYRYEKLFASLFFQVNTGRGFDIALRLQGDRKWEARLPLEEGADVIEEHWRTDRVLGLLRAIVPGWGLVEGWEFSPGLHLALRRWDVNGHVLTYSELLPHLWVEAPGFDLGAKSTLRWLVGYELTYHGESGEFEEALGERYRPAREDFHGILHHRINTGLQLAVGERAALRLMVTWDLDGSTANGRVWQGGVGQMRVSF